MRACGCIALLLLSAPAWALFLAGQAQEGGELSILCEGQRSAYVSAPDGSLRALPLGPDWQAAYYPAAQGPHTVQCGNETKTVAVRLAAQPSGLPEGGGGDFFPQALALALAAAAAAGAAFAFMRLARGKTEFSKRASECRVELGIFAGEELRNIEVSDPDAAEGRLSIPRLAAGSSWRWEYERGADGGRPAPARMTAATARGEISLVSGAKGAQPDAQKGRETRQLPKGG